MQALTEVQRIKAQEALAKKKQLEQMQAKSYMSSLRVAIDMQTGVTGILPYRIVLDQLKKYMDNKCCEKDIPNIVYPHDSKTIGLSDCTIDEPEKIKGIIEQYGINNKDSLYYYAHFLKNYNFDRFKEFDFTGGVINGVNIEEWRKLLKQIQNDYMQNPDRYYNPC